MVIERPLKRRKHSIDILSSPPQSSPLKRVQIADQVEILEDIPTSPAFTEDDELSDALEDWQPFQRPIRRLPQTSRSQSLLQRSFGGFDALSRGLRHPDHCSDSRSTTANFVTTPNDIHTFNGSSLPFCTASCNTNPLIAIGEEEGGVRLIDPSSVSDFSKVHISFRPHHNAIMDIAFSSDDYTLATASGDQTARMIDMHTQKTVCIMSGHISSVKQVRFQPSDNNIVSTSSRDGSVQIWDMRCGGKGSVANLRTSFARNVDNGVDKPTVRFAKTCIPMAWAHLSTAPTKRPADDQGLLMSGSRSITSIQYLPAGRDHLLVTAGELNASLKLWDLRNTARRGTLMPLSSTTPPASHLRTRNFGINSLSFSTDGARLYAACRDGAVYAYSTNHFVLGCAPEMSNSSNTSRVRMTKETKSTIGPLYAFRHPSLRLNSFYVKTSVREAQGDKSEILAVGSSDNCVVLFPTDERHISSLARSAIAEEDLEEVIPAEDAGLPSLQVPSNPKILSKDARDGLPAHQTGTPLIRGHTKEVTSLTWTYDGELVTLSDDFTARCWREDDVKARDLRSCGEGKGARWRCGWAEADNVLDDEE